MQDNQYNPLQQPESEPQPVQPPLPPVQPIVTPMAPQAPPVQPATPQPFNPFANSSPLASQQPVAPPQPPYTPAPAPKKRFNKLFLFGGIGLAVLLTVLGFIFIPRILQSAELAKLDTGLPYIYKATLTNIDPKGKFEYPLGFTPKKDTERPLDSYHEYFQVFSDDKFTKVAVDTLMTYIDHNGKLIIGPSTPVDIQQAYDLQTKGKVALAKDREWGFHDKYFLVQYVDLNSGKKLEKPIVQPFQVEHMLSTPKVSYSLDEKGNLNLSWEKVENAAEYIVARVDRRGGSGSANVYATLPRDTLTWSSTSESNMNTGFTQNLIISERSRTADEAQYTGTGSIDQEAFSRQDDIDVAVFARLGSEVSGYESLDTLAIRAEAPYSFATYTARAMNIEVAGAVEKVSDIPATVPVSLADGRTALQSITVNVDAARISNNSIFNTDTKRYMTTLDVPYTVDGTGLSWTYRIENFDKNNYKQQLQDVIAANKEKQVKTGAASFAILEEPKAGIDTSNAVKTMPSVPYKVNGSTEFVKFIAANLINGNELIDVSKYVKDGSITPQDAFQEATSQNPYAMYVSGYYYSESKKMIQVSYSGERAKRSEKIKALSVKVKSVVQSIIKGNMSQTDKVRAINTYITDNAKYNYDALAVSNSFLAPALYADAWTAYGILLDGTAVCGGYSLAFKALADEAGLESVYITGYIDSTNRHAWNKVKVDGKWTVIDTTWNDSASSPNKYLMITDSQAGQLRSQVEDSAWIADPFLKQYQAL